MDANLSTFLRAYERQPWAPGHIDCCMFLASWAMWLGHKDPASHLRGAYKTDEGFRAIIEAAGGLVPVVSECAINIHGKRIQRPFCGSIGVIGSPTNIHRQFGAIFDGERWLVRFVNSVGPMAAKPLAIWSI